MYYIIPLFIIINWGVDKIYKKIFCLFSIIIIIFSITLAPAFNDKTNLDNYNKIEIGSIKNKSFSCNFYEIKDIIHRVQRKILNNENPEKEIKELISFSEIRDIIIKISDEDTLYTIESLLFESNLYKKFNNINNYKTIISETQKDYNLSKFQYELNEYISSNYSFFNNFSIFEEFNITNENLNEYLDNWNNTLEGNSILKSIISKYNFYTPSSLFIVLFAVIMVIWGFTWGVFSAYNPELFCFVYMIIESFILSMSASISMGFLFSLDIPIFNHIVNVLCNISYITFEEVIAISSSLVCLTVTAAFILLSTYNQKFHAICSGLWIILPPVIITLILDKSFFNI